MELPQRDVVADVLHFVGLAHEVTLMMAVRVVVPQHASMISLTDAEVDEGKVVLHDPTRLVFPNLFAIDGFRT